MKVGANLAKVILLNCVGRKKGLRLEGLRLDLKEKLNAMRVKKRRVRGFLFPVDAISVLLSLIMKEGMRKEGKRVYLIYL